MESTTLDEIIPDFEILDLETFLLQIEDINYDKISD